MPDKKKYEPPKISRVELNQEQAILATCQIGEVSMSNARGRQKCKVGCRDGNNGTTAVNLS